MDKLLSISIASYNVEKTLPFVVNSLLVKEIINLIEIIIVNDGSKDSTLDIANSYAKQYPNSIIVIDKKNGGWGSTVNASIKIAKGKYFKLLDGDDCFLTKNLPDFIKFLSSCNEDIILTDFDYVYDNKKEHVDFEYPPLTTFAVSNIKKLYMHSLTVKKEIANKINLLDNCFYTDTEFNVKSVLYSATFVYLPITIYQYQMGDEGQSVSKTGYRKHCTDHERMLKEILPIIYNDNKFSNLIENHYNSLACDQLYIYLFTKNKKKEFFDYYKYLKSNFPLSLKNMSLVVKIAIKLPLMYNFENFILSKH